MLGPIVKTCIAHWNKSFWHVVRRTDHHHFHPLPNFLTSFSKVSQCSCYAEKPALGFSVEFSSHIPLDHYGYNITIIISGYITLML